MSSQNFSIFLSMPSFAFELTFMNAFATKSNSSGLKEVERFLSRSSVVVGAFFVEVGAFFFFLGIFFFAEATVVRFVLLVFFVARPKFERTFCSSARVSDSDSSSLLLDESTEATYLLSDDAELMFIGRENGEVELFSLLKQ